MDRGDRPAIICRLEDTEESSIHGDLTFVGDTDSGSLQPKLDDDGAADNYVQFKRVRKEKRDYMTTCKMML